MLYLLCLNNAHADIYFNAKIAGPITNVSAINDNGEFYQVTSGESQQDKSFAIASPDLIAFASNRSKSSNHRVQQTMNIFLWDKVLTQLSQSDHFSFDPQFSPDKKTLTYISQSQDKSHHLYAYNLKTKTHQILFSAPQIFDYKWSKDNQSILYSYADSDISAIKLYIIDSNKQKTLLNHPIKALQHEKQKNTDNEKFAYLISATWSPDETKIAFIHHPLNNTESKSLKIYELATQKITKLSKINHQVQSPLDWRSDSKAVLYSALVNYKAYYDENLRDKVYEGAMHVFVSETEGKTTQLSKGNHYHGRPVYSPDEKQIAYLFAKKLGGQRTYRLRTMDSDGNNDQQHHSSVYRESSIVWTKAD